MPDNVNNRRHQGGRLLDNAFLAAAGGRVSETTMPALHWVIANTMNKKHLTQVWQWLSVLGLLFLLSSVISLQGGADFVGKLVGDMANTSKDNKPAVGYFGAIIGGGLFFLGTGALALHAKRHGRHWHERIPLLWFDNMKTDSWEGQFYQMLMLITLLFLPAVAITRCIAEAEQGDICETGSALFYDGDKTLLIWPPVAQATTKDVQMRLRSGSAAQTPCVDGVQIFPRIGTPLLIYGLPVAGACAGILAILLIFRPAAVSTPAFPPFIQRKARIHRKNRT